mmetsp:Transcript_4362/g.9065  ORF Transcript_4362/g.9065 Transcript_4362/m.9065 type:complete len:107 (-) Transcript_4362:369-689(-)
MARAMALCKQPPGANTIRKQKTIDNFEPSSFFQPQKHKSTAYAQGFTTLSLHHYAFLSVPPTGSHATPDLCTACTDTADAEALPWLNPVITGEAASSCACPFRDRP